MLVLYLFSLLRPSEFHTPLTSWDPYPSTVGPGLSISTPLFLSVPVRDVPYQRGSTYRTRGMFEGFPLKLMCSEAVLVNI